MKKSLFIVCALGLFCANAIAGGLVTNTNQNIHFVRMFARNASTDIDAVYFNPAGTALLEEGFALSLNSQTIIQKRRITAEFPMFENGEKTFDGETFVPVFPSIDLAYNTGKWSFSGAFSVIGGGGQCEFKHGLPMFEAPIATIPVLLNNNGLTTTKYDVDIYLNGEQYIYSFQAGAAYQFNDFLSVYAGARLNWVRNHYDGHIRDIQINPVYAGNPSGDMISAPAFFTAMSAVNPAMTPYIANTSDMELDVDMKGFGITPIIGVNLHEERLNIGIRYEMNTSIEIENDTKTNTLPVGKKETYDDGVKTDNDIPAILSIGAEYAFTDQLRGALGWNHYFDSQAELPWDRDANIDNGINEYLWGVEYDLTDRLTVSGGMQFTVSGVNDDYQSDLNFSLSSYSFGFGGAYQLTPALKLNLGYFCTKYSKWDVSYANYNATGIAGKNTYHRFSNTFGIGLDFKF